MIHANTIKAAVRKQFPEVKIESITRHKFGMFSVKVFKEMPKSKKLGLVFGETADLESEEMVKLDAKIDWL